MAENILEIYDTKRENNLIVHLAKTLPKNIEGTFTAKIDVERRRAIERNHSATHILHEALRQVLGTHVEQKGSYVSPEILRFDFAHYQKMTTEEIRKVEHIANKHIRENFINEESREIPIAEAQKMGAMALFGEKYGEKVRVVKFGNSVELCGGTHVHYTGEIGMMRIISESSIAAGIRRIEAITGETIENLLDNQFNFMAEVKEFLNNAPDLQAAIRKIVAENADLKKRVGTFVIQHITKLADEFFAIADEINGIKIVRRVSTEITAEQAKMLAFQLRSRHSENLAVVIGCVSDGKPSLIVLFSDDLVAKGMNAVEIIRDAAKEIQGGGGGQPFFAQAGGKNADGIEKAVEKAVEKLSEIF
jgi:alanyl-tRNA synthetase